jgi:dTDP-4-dehydrorhamnose reductase
MLNLMQLCETLKVHLTIFGSGLVFDGKKEIYTEEDVPNLTNRVYTKLRCELENKLHLFPNTLYLRILYPCTFDGHPKCFYTKTKSRADNINDVKVPLTIVPYLFKYIPEIIESGTVGILNFTNNGNVSLVKLLELSNIEYTINNSNNSNNYKLSTNLLESILHKKIENVEEIIKTFI